MWMATLPPSHPRNTLSLFPPFAFSSTPAWRRYGISPFRHFFDASMASLRYFPFCHFFDASMASLRYFPFCLFFDASMASLRYFPLSPFLRRQHGVATVFRLFAISLFKSPAPLGEGNARVASKGRGSSSFNSVTELFCANP